MKRKLRFGWIRCSVNWRYSRIATICCGGSRSQQRCLFLKAAQKAKELAEQAATEQAAIAAKAKAERAAAELRKASVMAEDDRAIALQKEEEARQELTNAEAARIANLEEQQRKGELCLLQGNSLELTDCGSQRRRSEPL